MPMMATCHPRVGITLAGLCATVLLSPPPYEIAAAGMSTGAKNGERAIPTMNSLGSVCRLVAECNDSTYTSARSGVRQDSLFSFTTFDGACR